MNDFDVVRHGLEHATEERALDRIQVLFDGAKEEVVGLREHIVDLEAESRERNMGDDAAIVQAARVSYGEGTRKVRGDRALIRYLLSHRHTTPFEMVELKIVTRVPMDVWRQWIRHRTACLTADTVLHFDGPGVITGTSKAREPRSNKIYKTTVGEIFERFQPSQAVVRPDRQRDPYFKRNRIQNMYLRCVNEDTGAVQHTRIVDIWCNGEREVFRVETESGAMAKMSADHLCLTPNGWRKLKELQMGSQIQIIGPGRGGVIPHFVPIDEGSETWLPIVGWEDFYEVSDQGRVRRTVGGQGCKSFGHCKKITVSQRRARVSLNRPSEQFSAMVHQLVLEAFVGSAPDGMESCHNDGLVVHNSVNELDALLRGHRRLSRDPVGGVAEAIQGEQTGVRGFPPSGDRRGSHEGRGHPTGPRPCREVYEERLEMGVAREQARKDLPLSTMTEAYWKIDGHNLLHFLGLRCDPHAQKEIRAFAVAIGEVVEAWLPMVWEAFVDFRLRRMSSTSGPERVRVSEITISQAPMRISSLIRSEVEG